MDKLYDMNELLGKRKDESLDEFVQRGIYEAEKQYEEGKVISVDELFKEWNQKYGI